MKQTDKLFKEIIRISGDSYLDKYICMKVELLS